MQNFKWKVEFWKTLYLHRELDNFPRIKNSSDTSGDINNVILWNKELGQHLEELHNSVNLYFPSDQCMMLQNSLKQQVTEHEEPWSGFRLTFKRHNLSSSGVVAKKNIYNNLNRSLKRSILLPSLFVRQNFLHKPPPKQPIAADWIFNQIWEFSSLLLRQMLQVYKM